MSIIQVEAVAQFIGLSSDIKPIVEVSGRSIPAGSCFLESDTGSTWRWTGTAWILPPAVTTKTVQQPSAVTDPPASTLEEILLEVRRLRQGMVQANDAVCVEVEGDVSPNEE